MAKLQHIRQRATEEHERLRMWIEDRTGLVFFRGGDQMLASLQFFGEATLSRVALSEKHGSLYGVPFAILVNEADSRIVLLADVPDAKMPSEWLIEHSLDTNSWRWFVRAENKVISEIGASDVSWSEAYRAALRIGFLTHSEEVVDRDGQDLRGGTSPGIPQEETASREILMAIALEKAVVSGSNGRAPDLFRCVLKLHGALRSLVDEIPSDDLAREAAVHLNKARDEAEAKRTGACAASLSFFIEATRELVRTRPKVAREFLGQDVTSVLLLE